MEESTKPSAAIEKIITPGDLLVISCPDGTTPNLKAGEWIPNVEDPNFFVLAVKGPTFTLGPTKSGTFEIAYKCQDQDFKATIEVPAQDPSKIPPREGPLDLITHNIMWLWIALALALALTLLGAFLWQHKKRRRILDAKKVLLTNTGKKDSHQILKEMIITLENVEKTPTSPDIKSDDLYQKGYRSVRGFLETELKLKTQAETTPQFLGSLRIIAPNKGISAELLSKIERSMNFSDQNRFGAALSDSPEARKNYAAELRSILQSLLNAGVSWRQPATTNPRGKTR